MPPSPAVHARIETRQGGDVAFLTIDRPARLNAFSSELMAAFVAEVEKLAAREALRAIVIGGAGGRAFVGGADIDEIAAIDGPENARAFIGKVHACCAAVRDLPAPTIARIEGYALGAGLELAAACDLRLASDASVFGMPEVKLGVPSVVEAALLPALVGWGRAREMLLLGETFGAQEALRVGLIDAVASGPDLDGEVERRLAAILSCDARAVRLQKALIRAWEDLPLRDAIAAGVPAFASAFETDAPARAIAAFKARRRAAKPR